MPSRAHQLLRPILAFVAAVLATAALGSVAQTQLNLQALIDLGMTIELPLRMRSTLQDLLNFAPLWAAIVLIAFALAFPVAWAIRRWWRGPRTIWFPLAGAVAIFTALALMQTLLGITAVAAARSGLGLALLCLAGAAGGWIQARFG